MAADWLGYERNRVDQRHDWPYLEWLFRNGWANGKGTIYHSLYEKWAGFGQQKVLSYLTGQWYGRKSIGCPNGIFWLCSFWKQSWNIENLCQKSYSDPVPKLQRGFDWLAKRPDWWSLDWPCLCQLLSDRRRNFRSVFSLFSWIWKRGLCGRG